jgi:PAS domain S-box-containing protein
MNDLLAITKLPAMWAGGDHAHIGNTLVEVLDTIIGADFLFLRLPSEFGQSEFTRGKFGQFQGFSNSEELASYLTDTLGGSLSSWPPMAKLQLGPSRYTIMSEQLGTYPLSGVLVAGAQRESFPNEQERLLLSVAANQAALALKEALRAREDAQAESARELKKTINAVPVMAWSTLPDGRADFFNEHFLAYLGFAPEQAFGWGWAAALHPDDAEGLKAIWVNLVASGRAGETEARLRRWDGEYRWFLFRANPVRTNEGDIYRWYGTNTDIDDRKRTEEELRRSAAFLSQAQRLSKTGSIWWKPATGGVYWSDETYKVLEYPITSKPSLSSMLARCHPDDLPSVQGLLTRATRHGQSVEIEHRLLMPEGGIKYICVVLQNIASNPAEPEFVGAITDITERKTTEERIRRSELLLAEGQRISQTGTFSWEVESNEITFSEELNRIFGFDAGTVVDFDLITQRVYQEDLPLLATKMADVREGGDNPDYDIRLLIDGRIKHVRVVGRIVHHLDGTRECIGAVQDVSAQLLAEAARDELRSELTQLAKVMSLSAVAASIAHEINQPLLGILTNASTSQRMLSAMPPNIEGALETARRTIRDGKRAAAIITRLRNLFKQGMATVEVLDLNDAAREVSALLATDLQKERVALRLELSEALPLVAGDRVQLQQVIMNLLRNSIDAIALASPTSRRIVLRTALDDTTAVRLTVEDTGCGLENAEVERLFDPFYTTKADGMGIGLNVSRTIVEAHGGKIWATGASGGGALIGFSIPTHATSAQSNAGSKKKIR